MSAASGRMTLCPADLGRIALGRIALGRAEALCHQPVRHRQYSRPAAPSRGHWHWRPVATAARWPQHRQNSHPDRRQPRRYTRAALLVAAERLIDKAAGGNVTCPLAARDMASARMAMMAGSRLVSVSACSSAASSVALLPVLAAASARRSQLPTYSGPWQRHPVPPPVPHQARHSVPVLAGSRDQFAPPVYGHGKVSSPQHQIDAKTDRDGEAEHRHCGPLIWLLAALNTA